MKKILLIEKDEMIMKNTSDFLKGEGYNVFTCSNTNDGIHMAIKVGPDVILSDINQPDMNEFEICKAMQSQPSTSLIPIVFITERPQDVMTGMQIGAEDFLRKPFSNQQLLNTLTNVIKAQPSFASVL